jgi:hypothetical protein
MATLEKRVEALEATAGGMDEPVLLLLCGFEPGHLDAEIVSLRSPDGTIWKRKQHESEQAFKDRASREACKAAEVVLLVAVMRGWVDGEPV